MEVIVFLLSYLIGSIPFSYIIPKLRGIDIRKHGSGNVGGTNVYRVLGLPYAILSGGLDMAKAYLACYLAWNYIGTPEAVALAGVGVMLGHVFSIFLKFKSGKGVSTFLGFLLFTDVRILAIVLFIMVIGTAMTKIVSINSISAVVWAPMLSVIFNDPTEYTLALIVMMIIVIYAHRSNIKRLIKGKELKIK